MSHRDRLFAVAVLLGVVIVVGLMLFRTAPVPPAIAKTADSLATTKPAFDSALVASDVEAKVTAKLQRQSAAWAKRFRDSANAAQRGSDTLAVMVARDTTARDSLTHLVAEVEERAREATALRLEIAQHEERISLLVSDTVRLSRDKALALARVAALDEFNQRLQKELARRRACGRACQLAWAGAGGVTALILNR